MIKRLLVLLLSLALTNVSWAQKLSSLNQFKYVYLPPLIYENNQSDIYKIVQTVKLRLEKSGMRVINSKAPLIANPDIENGSIVTCVVSHSDINNHYLFKKDTVSIQFVDCLGETVYLAKAPTKGFDFSPENAYEKATKAVLKDFEKYRYSYQPGGSYDSKALEARKLTRKAVYPGGVAKMDEFLTSAMIYPKGTQRLAGTVDLSFVIDSRGFVKEVQVVKGLRADIDNEVRRVFMLMPRWIPGLKEGKLSDTKLAYSLVVEPKGKINQERVDY